MQNSESQSLGEKRKMKLSVRLAVILITIMVCCSIIGGAYALYSVDAVLNISFSGKAVEWAPVDGGYYIVGTFSDWSVNANAIYLNKDLTGTTDKAAIEKAPLKTEYKFKVVQYHASTGLTWLDVGWNNGTPSVGSNVSVLTNDGNNITVTKNGDYFVCVNQWNQVWIAPA